MRYKRKAGYTLFEVIFVIATIAIVLGGLALVSTLVYVACHFLAMVW